jgi:hypothetical protein
MSSKAITMRKMKEVLRLRFECGLSLNAIARTLELSKGAVAKYDALARAAQLLGHSSLATTTIYTQGNKKRRKDQLKRLA